MRSFRIYLCCTNRLVDFFFFGASVGLGKSSTISPMLLVHYAHRRDGLSVRLHLLPAMLGETCATLAQSVGACAVDSTLFVLPYSRASVRFGGSSLVRRFEDEMLRTPGAVLCTTPDWRLSHELTMDQSLVRPPQRCRKYVNVLDESDLLLHYRYELVYAMGTSLPLPNFLTRVEAVQS